MAGGLFGGGTGTELDPFLVEDAEDLSTIRSHFLGENYMGQYYYYKQVKDIDFKLNSYFTPIGASNFGPPFMSSYDGQGYAIKNLTIDSAEVRDIGLFGYIGNDAVVKNVHIEKAKIRVKGDGQTVGILAGLITSASLVEECTIKDSEIVSDGTGTNSGGLAGTISSSTVKRCSVRAKIQGANVGGFASYLNEGVIEDCYVIAELKGIPDENNVIAGFVNNAIGEIKNSLANVKYIDYPNYAIMRLFTNDSTVFNNSYFDLSSIPFWETGIEYPNGVFTVGTDGNVYQNIRLQYAEDVGAQPISGELWQDYWQLANAPEVKSSEQLKDINTYVGWDFNNIWKMVNGQVLLKFEPDPVSPEPGFPELVAEFFTKINGKWFRLVNSNN